MTIHKIITTAILASFVINGCKDSATKKESVSTEVVPEINKNEQNTDSTNGQWIVDKNHSKLAFIVDHHGITEVDGYFKRFEAKVTAKKEDLSDAVFEVTVETASIFTDLEERDNELKDEDLFHTKKFPTMTFKSTSFRKVQGNKYVMLGDLTIKGVTKPITLDVTITGPNAHPNPDNKSLQFGIKGVAVIKRSDFGVGGRLTSAFVSDEVQIRVTGGFEKRKL
ncbi:MAG: YceI family protein [Bacteroidota bacterium]